MNRRTFLQTAGAGAAGVAMLGPAACRSASSMAVPERIGVNLYTVRGILVDDFAGVLRQVRRIGYEEVEFAGYHGRDPRELKAILNDADLIAPAAHVQLFELRADFDAWVDAALLLGHRYLVVPWLDPRERESLDGYRRVAEELNAFGERMRGAGIRLAYHNHDFEFETFGGDRSGYDVLLDRTEAALVAMELDLYWAVSGGQDPVVYFERYPGRFPLVHAKDRTADGRMVDVGAGSIDFARIFAHSKRAGIVHAFVEHDEPADSLESLRASYDHLARVLALRDGRR